MRTVEADGPYGYLNPDWSVGGQVHNWKNYISDEMEAEWLNFTEYQRQIIANNAYELSDNEHWD